MRVLRTGARLGHSTSERRRAIRAPASVAGPGAHWNAGSRATPRPQAADGDDGDGQHDLDSALHHRARVAAEPLLDDAIPEDHLGGDPSENASPEVDDPPEPRHEPGQETAPPEH